MNEKKKLADALRILSMDAVQKANSGHPGAPMGLADMSYALFKHHLSYNPLNPKWINRDRFVLSIGHASALYYALLHLTGYELTIEDLKNFRQMGALTAGHPELDHPQGIETTTGPLAQGFANAVGMALAEKILAAKYNKPNYNVVDHYTYAFVGDGDLMEGLSHEVASLAGTWALDKLIVFYDDNGISIDGEVDQWFTDDTAKRFESYGWHVINEVDGHYFDAITKAVVAAKTVHNKPTLIICKTKIGYGSPNKESKASSHGAPLGDEEIELTRKNLGWEYDERFFIPEDIYAKWDHKKVGQEVESKWNDLFASYQKEYPSEAAELVERMSGVLNDKWVEDFDLFIEKLQKDEVNVATRKASQLSLDELGQFIVPLIGGSADLAPSNLTIHKNSKAITTTDANGNYIHFGVREFGMTSIMSGLALHGGFIPYGGTFLVFMEYARNAVRMAALMGLQVIYIYTHDSIGLGEDGPTHQPVEQMAFMRLTPNMVTWRPADAAETAVAWKEALLHKTGPTALFLSRQNLPMQKRTKAQLKDINKGAYVLYEAKGEGDLIILATGSEVELAIAAAQKLASEKIGVKVVSMVSPEVFEKQSDAYKEKILPKANKARLAVEAGIRDWWYKYVGLEGTIIGIDTFGMSAPFEDLFEYFNITSDNVYKEAKKLVKK